MQCSNNLKQIGIALHNCHDVKKRLPGGVNTTKEKEAYNNAYLSAHGVLLPFMENTALYDLMNESTSNSDSATAPFTTQVSGIKCPSDSGASQGLSSTDRGVTSYMYCTGDWRPSPGYEQNNYRGAFVARTIIVRTLNSIVDGTSNTIATSEHPVGRGETTLGKVEFITRDSDYVAAAAADRARFCLNRAPGGKIVDAVTFQTADSGGPVVVTQLGFGRGSRAWSGMPAFTLFNTILPPNSPSCSDVSASATTTGNLIVSAASYHTGGVNLILLDGAGKFVSDSIDTGTLSSNHVSEKKSPYGVWGAAGSINGKESLQLP